MTTIDSAKFRREPLKVVDGVPFFSAPNEFIENYEKISSDHLAAFDKSGENPFIQEQLWKEFEGSTIALVKKYAKPGQKILDVGVGMGRVLSNFPELSRFGMDISQVYLKKAQAEGIDVCYSAVDDMPFREQMFDVVMSTDVLEHVIDLNKSCAAILSVIKPGGVLIVRVPYKENLQQYIEPGYPYRFSHLRNFDKPSLTLLFTRIFDAEIVEFVTVGHHFDVSKLKYRLPLPKWDGVLFHSLKLIGKVWPALHRRLLAFLYEPIEVNAVVRKKGGPVS